MERKERRRSRRRHIEQRDSKRTSNKEMSSRKNKSRAKDRHVKKIKQVTRRKSDAPTVAIAPSDYAHIFHAGAETQTPTMPKKTETLGNLGDFFCFKNFEFNWIPIYYSSQEWCANGGNCSFRLWAHLFTEKRSTNAKSDRCSSTFR